MSEAILILLGALFGAAASGAVQVAMAVSDRRLRRRVAARIFLGDIAEAEAAFKLLAERRAWPDRLDFDPAFETWREYRSDLAAEVTALEWTRVGSFYSNLQRSARMIRPGEPCTEGDLRVAAEQVELAEEAWAVASQHVAKNEKERNEIIEQLRQAGDEA